MASQAPYSRKGSMVVVAISIAILAASILWVETEYHPSGDLQHTEKLVLNTSTDASNSTLIISVVNSSPSSATVTQVMFDNVVVVPSDITPEGNFTRNSTGGFVLEYGDSGELLIGRSGLNVTSGQTYDILVVTAPGNSYPTVGIWS